MNREAFEQGLHAELIKHAVGAYTPPPKPAVPNLGLPSVPKVDRGTRTQDLIHQQGIAQEESKNVPSTLGALGHDYATPSFSGGLATKMFGGFAKDKITSQIQGAKPGEVVKPLTSNQMLDHDSVMQMPEMLAHAKEQAALKSQEVAKATPLGELSGLSAQYQGPNDPLNNALKQHIGNDPGNLKALSGIVGDKTYGAFGVGPGLTSKLTPGSFRAGDFLSENWKPLLAGGGLLAALAYAMKGNGEEKQQPQQPIINNYMGGTPSGQQQFGTMRGYGQ
jgi:hypothetical protein